MHRLSGKELVFDVNKKLFVFELIIVLLIFYMVYAILYCQWPATLVEKFFCIFNE